MSSPRPSLPRLRRGGRTLVAAVGIGAIVLAVLGAGLAFLFASWLHGAVDSNASWRTIDRRLVTIESLTVDLTIDVLNTERPTTRELIERRGEAIRVEIEEVEALVAAEEVESIDLDDWMNRLGSGQQSLVEAAVGTVNVSAEDRAAAMTHLESASADFRAEVDLLHDAFRDAEARELADREGLAGSVLNWATLGVFGAMAGLAVLLGLSHSSVRQEQSRVGVLSRQANEDPLTGLVNRRGFNGIVGDTIRECAESEWAAAILYMDLDGFKRVNDTLGHQVGDQLLVAVSERLLENTRSNDTVARLGGDEFSVLLRWSSGDFDPIAVADRIQHELSQPFVIGEHRVEIGASVGVRSIGDETESASQLIRDADIAMYRSKTGGGASVEIHEAAMTVEADKRNAIEAALHESIRNKPYRVVYEPVYDSEGRLVGADSQVRWPLSDGTEVLHEDFAPVAVDLGLSDFVDANVLQQTADQFAQLNATIHQSLWVSVTVDAAEVEEGGLERRVVETLEASGLDASALVLKIVDRGAANRARVMIENVETVRRFGVKVSIDELPSLTEQLASKMIADARLASQGRLAGDVVTFEDLSSMVLEQEQNQLRAKTTRLTP